MAISTLKASPPPTPKYPTLKEHLERILDFPAGGAGVRAEAHSKLAETYMMVNGELALVKEFGSTEMLIVTRGSPRKLVSDIQSLDVCLPETGVYFTKDRKGALFLSRLPKRQWKRSLSGTFYKIEELIGSANLFSLDYSSPHSFWISPKGNVYHMCEKVGHLDQTNKEVICTKETFLQEMKDWLRDGRWENDIITG